MHFQLKSLTQSKGLLQTLIIMGGSFISSGFAAVALILITRQLGPERFGEFSVGFSILLILTRFNDLGMTNAVQKYAAQESEHSKINKIFSYATKVRIIGCLIVCIIGVLFSGVIAEQLHFSKPIIIYLAFFCSIATTFYEHLQAMLQSLHEFLQSAIGNVVQAGVKVIGAVVLFLLVSTNTTGIFALYMLAPAAPVLFFPLLFPKWVKLTLKDNFSTEYLTLKNVALHSALGFIAAGIIENVDVLFVQRYLSTYEAGLLGGVSRIALLFSIIAYSLSTVLNPRLARYKNKVDINAFLKKAGVLIVITIGAYLLFLPFSQIVMHFTIGDAYLPGLPIMNILVAASFLSIAIVPLMALFFSFDKPWYFSVSGILQLVIILVGNTIFVPTYGLEATAWTRLVARLALLIFTVVYAWMAYKKRYVTKT